MWFILVLIVLALYVWGEIISDREIEERNKAYCIKVKLEEEAIRHEAEARRKEWQDAEDAVKARIKTKQMANNESVEETLTKLIATMNQFKKDHK